MNNESKDAIMAQLDEFQKASIDKVLAEKESFMKRCEALESDVRELEKRSEVLGKEKTLLLNDYMEASKKISELERTARPRRTDSAKAIMVIKTESLEGRGTEDDPCRCVTQYWDSDGGLLAVRDSLADMESVEIKQHFDTRTKPLKKQQIVREELLKSLNTVSNGIEIDTFK